MRSLRYFHDLCFDPPASRFYRKLRREYLAQKGLIDVLPAHKVIYVSVPKCASTTIKAALSMLSKNEATPPKHPHDRKETLLQSPHDAPSQFYRLAKDPAALRFSFVRNPYVRLLSAWSNKFKDTPLVRGSDSFIDQYLDYRGPPGPTDAGTLSFADFLRFACATADIRLDAHWQLQSEIINVPGVRLDFVGKVESFSADFQRVLDHVSAPDHIRNSIRAATLHFNGTGSKSIDAFYTAELAKCVYDAYERDFDLLGYPRALPD